MSVSIYRPNCVKLCTPTNSMTLITNLNSLSNICLSNAPGDPQKWHFSLSFGHFATKTYFAGRPSMHELKSLNRLQPCSIREILKNFELVIFCWFEDLRRVVVEERKSWKVSLRQFICPWIQIFSTIVQFLLMLLCAWSRIFGWLRCSVFFVGLWR